MRRQNAIRAFRAAYELGVRTVAVFPYEDRNSLHRQKADEAYQIGERGHPVSAYLDIASLIEVATDCHADAIYPGYGPKCGFQRALMAQSTNQCVLVGFQGNLQRGVRAHLENIVLNA